MPADAPYMQSVSHLPAILSKIREAGAPPRFTHEFLKSHLGFPSSNDRAVISVLKQLGLLSSDGTPTPRYNEYRDATKSGYVLAAGLREGWSDIFLADQKAYLKSASDLKQLFKNVTGKGESVAEKMATTFKALAGQAVWDATTPLTTPPDGAPPDEEPGTDRHEESRRHSTVRLHHDVHVHLPATSDQAVYTAIFRALREELLD